MVNNHKMQTRFDITSDITENDNRHPKEIWEKDFKKHGYKYDEPMEQILFIVDHPVFLGDGDSVVVPNYGYCIVTNVLYDAIDNFIEYQLKLC